DPSWLNIDEVALASANDALGSKCTSVARWGIGLRNHKRFLTIGREIIQMTADLSAFDLSVRCLQKSEIVDPGECCQGRDKTNVRPFRSFHRANTTVVGRMHIADFKSGAIAR